MISLSAIEPYLDIPADLAQEKETYLKKFGEQNKLEGENTTALVVGRFQPPHAGHVYVIEAALRVTDKVVIGIGSANKINEENPFTPEYREQVLRFILKKEGLLDRVTFVRLDDLGDNDKWGRATIEQAGKIDAVVGNSDWVNGIFAGSEYKAKGIRVLRPPVLGRNIFEGALVRRELRAAGLLRSSRVVM